MCLKMFYSSNTFSFKWNGKKSNNIINNKPHCVPPISQAVLTWSGHAPSYCHRILPPPLLQFFLHLLHFGWVESPQAALPWRVPLLVLNFLEALVQGEVVTDWVLPAIGCCLIEQKWNLRPGRILPLYMQDMLSCKGTKSLKGSGLWKVVSVCKLWKDV